MSHCVLGGKIYVAYQGKVFYQESGEVLEQAGTPPSMEVFKGRLDGALGSLV